MNNYIFFNFKVILNQIRRIPVNFYSKNKKTERKKLPSEEKATQKWMPNRKV
jgi:hypothetical protein